ncbi:flagellar biosynthesis regulator FlaF [Falsiroseomonas sp.]|uniref:flagellar biosynthesis regulator FlaF n=1 Tax=Falsiroseomonas sp. TaxID=2870721 RepID=UPI003F72680A
MSVSRYAATQNAVASPREIELRAFRYVNGLLAAATNLRGRAVALEKTHRMWSILINDLGSPGNKLPAELRGRLISLGLWAQKETDLRLDDGGSLEPLMALHRDMIEALEAQRGAAQPALPSAPVLAFTSRVA